MHTTFFHDQFKKKTHFSHHEKQFCVYAALNLIYHTHLQKVEGLLLSDAEKAFDQVAWDIMMATCKHIGLATNMLGWIETL